VTPNICIDRSFAVWFPPRFARRRLVNGGVMRLEIQW
jgi:hypothetical protein